MNRQIDIAMKKGIKFLSSKQKPSGEFTTKQWIGDDACEKALPLHPFRENPFSILYDPFTAPPKSDGKSVFITSFILHSLKFLNEFINVEEMAQKAIKFLLNEKEEFGLWRFTPTSHYNHKKMVNWSSQ